MAEFVTDVFLVTARDGDMSTFILETTMHGQDGNLWESTWRHKAKRFIGYNRNKDDEFVVTDITVVADDKDIPDEYAGILITKDTREKGLRKHHLCYKRDSRSTASRAITEINVINPSKGELVPAHYTSTSQSLNEIQVMFKLEELHKQQPAPKPAPRTSPPVMFQQMQQASLGTPNSPVSGIDGVPFQINPKYDLKAALDDPVLGGINIISIEELTLKYGYSFLMEKQVLERT